MTQSLAATRHQLLQRIYGEYLEMPGLRLTHAQARRLWGLDERTCAEVLDCLTEDGFLYRRADGTFARRSDGSAFPPSRMLKAG